MTIAPWIWGLGVLGVGVAGVVAYEVVKAGPGAATGARIAPSAPPPPALRVALSPAGTFTSGGVQPPPGVLLTVVPGSMGDQVIPQTQYLVLQLPSGGKWTRVVYEDSTGRTVAQVGLGNDFTSAIALTGAQLASSQEVAAFWTDANGLPQTSIIPFTIQKVVTLNP